ncbi:Hypothetical protein DEACI_1832 [Acididesulfobacillus acetoxydans]|uniref:Uncharacterized protein n=1 Tax=Acididesulfobacillus acetoxydans TaxID=1561005 RepID=A0A8S0W7V5_9FIRM|nr:Hypothetical protein DEACI_1832 [Acididesulfobacillus acetoxydans]CEJ08542.1 Hypothetical protein DEACI_3019 [Acididesulfobacillus acetoxydans]
MRGIIFDMPRLCLIRPRFGYGSKGAILPRGCRPPVLNFPPTGSKPPRYDKFHKTPAHYFPSLGTLNVDTMRKESMSRLAG